MTITTCRQSFFQASIAWGFDWIGAVKLCFTGQFLRVIVGRQSPHSASAGGYNRRPALAFGLLYLELKRPQQETLFLLHSPGATAVPRQICWFRWRAFFNMEFSKLSWNEIYLTGDQTLLCVIVHETEAKAYHKNEKLLQKENFT